MDENKPLKCEQKDQTTATAFDYHRYLDMAEISFEEGWNICKQLRDSDAPEDIARLKEMYARLYAKKLIDCCHVSENDAEALDKMFEGTTLDGIYDYCQNYNENHGSFSYYLFDRAADIRDELFTKLLESNSWILTERYNKIVDLFRDRSGDDIRLMNGELISQISEEVNAPYEDIECVCERTRDFLKSRQMEYAFWKALKGMDSIEEERKRAVLAKFLSYSRFQDRIQILEYLKIYEDPDNTPGRWISGESSYNRAQKLAESVLSATQVPWLLEYALRDFEEDLKADLRLKEL